MLTLASGGHYGDCGHYHILDSSALEICTEYGIRLWLMLERREVVLSRESLMWYVQTLCSPGIDCTLHTHLLVVYQNHLFLFLRCYGGEVCIHTKRYSSPPSNKSFYYLLLQPMLLCSSVRNSSSFSRNLEKSRAISRVVAGFFIMGRYLKDVNISWPFIFIIWFKNEKWITTLYSMHDEFPIQSAKVLARICKK